MSNKSIQPCVKSNRNIGIELLRIVSMVMIVFIHCFGCGGILDNAYKFSLNYYVSYFIQIACFGAVNLYALISGYVCINSKNKYSRIINLWIEVFFYSVTISIIFLLLPNYRVGMGRLIFSFFPVTSFSYWYFTCYFCLFFAMPFINKAILNASKNIVRNVIIVGFILFTLINLFGNLVDYDMLKIGRGFSPIWLMYLYICGSYIKLWGNKTSKNYVNLIAYFICTIATFIINIGIDFVSENYFDALVNIEFLTYNSPFVFIGSIFLFKFFVNLNIQHMKKPILKVASVSFSVYLISVHPVFYKLVQKDMFTAYANDNLFKLLGLVFSGALIIYVSCTVIGLLVNKLFKILKIKNLAEYIENVFFRILHKLKIMKVIDKYFL